MDISNARKLKGLGEETAKLKKLLAEQMLDNGCRCKKMVTSMPSEAP